MAAHSLFSAAIVGAIASVSAAGLAVGTHIRNIEAAGGNAGIMHPAGGAPISTGALADSTDAPTDASPERVTDLPAIAPSFSRIVIEQAGISRLEGFGMPGGEVVIRSGGQPIAVAKPDRDGSWSVRLDHALPPGEHRLGSTTETPSRVLIGEDVRVFVPADFDGEKVIAYEAPQADVVRRRAETLAVIAAQDFDEALAKKAAEEKAPLKDTKPLKSADNSKVPGTTAAPESGRTDLTGPVVDWLDRSHRMFNDLVAKPLSVPPAGSGAAPPAADAAKTAEPAEVKSTAEAAEASQPAAGAEATLLDRVRNWFSGAGTAFESAVVKPLKQGDETPAAATEPKDSEANNDAAEKAAAEKAAADKRRAEEAARRVAEEQKRKEAALKEAEAKAAAEANSEAALKKAEDARRRQAEETEKMQADVKRAAEAAAKRTAETEKRLEESFKRLDEAEKKQRAAQDLKKADAAQRELDAARKEYQERRAASEEASGKKMAATAPVQPAPRNEPAPAEDKEAPHAANIAPVDAAEDARQEDEEYKILRRMIAEAKRLTMGEAPAKAEPEVADNSDVPADSAEASVEPASRRSLKSPERSVRARSKSASRECSSRRKGRRPGYHFVGPRDTLWGIARRHYGDGERYDIIYRANRDRIKKPDVLRPCQWIRIPGKRRYH